jgi:hypothetical protein
MLSGSSKNEGIAEGGAPKGVKLILTRAPTSASNQQEMTFKNVLYYLK